MTCDLRFGDCLELMRAMPANSVDLIATDPPYFKVKGLPAVMDGDELVSFWKSVWADFAAALKAWPEIRDAAEKVISPG